MSKPVRSMTGYARVSKPAPAGEVSVTLKSLNHRGLDIHFHTPPELDAYENSLRAAIKKSVIRGHLDVRIAFTPAENGQAGAGLNESLLRAYLAAFRKAAVECQIPDARIDLNTALAIPGMLSQSLEPALEAGLEPLFLAALEEALTALNNFREREGAELALFIHKHNRLIAEACREIEQIRSHAMPVFQQRLTDRLKDVLRNTSIEPQRLVQEAALLADRSDIGEEIERLRIHSGQLQAIVEDGGETGKKLDFLLQEMNREANTILSKTNGIGEVGLKITDLALAAKAEIEKIREQALNLE